MLQFTMQSLAGEAVDLAQYQGKVLLIVNVASECGYTPQYRGLDLVHGHRLGQRAQVLLAALAIECLGNGLFAALTAIVSEPRERARIALAREHGLDNCHPRHTGEVADDMLQLDIHLGAGLLHMLDMLPRIGQEHGPLLQITAQHADLVGRPKRTGQEAERVEALYPLAIVDVTLRPAPDLLDLLRIHEEHLEAARLQPPPPQHSQVDLWAGCMKMNRL